MPDVVIKESDFERYKNLRDLIGRTNKEKPKAADVAELRRILEEDPKLWRAAGDMARRAVEHVCGKYFDGSALPATRRERRAGRRAVSHTAFNLRRDI
ncbi:MAG: hypothetical protein M3416_16870 [Acidobacteriota bacterium]|nr:hypothetical protein [Acidobacteriota bacterium]